MRNRNHPIAKLSILAAAGALIAGCGSSSDTISTPPVASTSSNAASGAPTGSSASALAPIHGSYAPDINPADFVATVDNAWFPLKPGTVFRYQGVAENGKTPQLDIATVTNKTKRIQGVDCVVVRDVVESKGKPFERTLDWYAQDRDGNVWYFGEASSDHRNGKWVKSGGSFESGVNGALAGIIMPGNPQAGDAYRQEFYPGHALDQAKILSYTPAKVPYGSFKHTLTTVETTALEPGVREQKHYVRGVGETKSQDVAGSKEAFQLLSVRH